MKYLYYSALLAAAVVTSACTNDVEESIDTTNASDKTAIAFDSEANNTSLTRYGFSAATQIAMHIRSTKDASNIRETRTIVTASADATQSSSSYSDITWLNSDYVRYWDDAYGRSAQLSVFAVAVPSLSSPTNNSTALVDLLSTGTSTWNEGTLTETVAWTVSTDQSGTDVIANEDLTYSNNISASGEDGAKAYNYTTSDYDSVCDGQLLFRLKNETDTDGPGKFDKGHLKFNHALSRITINLIKGTGYADGSFSFATDQNISILNVPVAGTLDLEAGTWATTATGNIAKMATTTTASGATYSLVAQLIPGSTIASSSDDNMLDFVIDESEYFITQAMMFNALTGNSSITTETTSGITFEQGLNYVFNITVGKTEIINVTATLEPWTEVKAANTTIDNSHISLSLYNSDGTAATSFDLYRLNDESDEINTGTSTATNWGGNYTDQATLSQNGTTWETNWYYDNNKSFYHFRSVSAGTTLQGTANDTVDDYFEITSGDQANHDYHWGAPFVSSTTSPIVYNTSNGYAANLSPAIGATNSTVSMTELHMMSNVNVVLRTYATAGNAVALETTENSVTSQCNVSLTYFYADGTVLMGNGLVSTTGNLTESAAFTAPTAGTSADTDADYIKTGAFTFAAVPQSLVRTSGDNLYVGITIQTPDNNQYYVVEKLSAIVASTNGSSQNQTASEAITYWYPNHSYTYTFTLSKAGISNVTCTVSDWVTVTAADQSISLED